MEDIITFTKVKLPYGWLGNMAPYPIIYNGKYYKTSESLFQSMRFSQDDPIIDRIREEYSPMSAKMLAKKYSNRMIIKPLSKEDVNNMKTCIELKLNQNKELIEKLKNTNKSIIIEDVTRRGDNGSNLFWGMMLVNEKWIGKNILGKIWMNIRDSYLN